MTFSLTTDGNWVRWLARSGPGAEAPRGAAGLSRRTARLAGLLDDQAERPPEGFRGRAAPPVPLRESIPVSTDILGVERLGARLDWSDARAVMRIGGLAEPLDGLLRRRPGLTEAMRAFDRARDALEREEPRRALALATQAIDGVVGRPGDSHEFRFRMLRGLVRLGLARTRAGAEGGDPKPDPAGAYVDLAAAAEAAWDAFDALEATEADPLEIEAAEIDYLLAELSAAWAAYCRGDMRACRLHAEYAVEQHAGAARGHYLLAKAQAVLGDAEAALAAAGAAIAAEEGFAPLIAADGDFLALDTQLGDLLERLGREADALAARFETARARVVAGLDLGPVSPPPTLIGSRRPLAVGASAVARLAEMKRFASELWSFMAEAEIALADETPKLRTRLEARRGARGMARARLAKRALAAAAVCVLLGGALGQALAGALSWLEPDMPEGALIIGRLGLFALAALAAHRFWRRWRDDRRSVREDGPLERRRAWTARARIELNKGFDLLNGALKSPKHARYFPDTAAMFRLHLGGPTHIDRAEGRVG